MPVDRSVLFLFLDGVGIGQAGRSNPFDNSALEGFSSISGAASWTSTDFLAETTPSLYRRLLDARLGVPGLPQSGTGQATLFTGLNCATLAGRHYGPYPHSANRDTIRDFNIFSRLFEIGLDSAFANAYPPQFFSYMKKTDRWTVTTRCCIDAGVRIRETDEIQQRSAVPADLTGRGLRARIPSLPETSEVESAETLAMLAEQYPLTLFEYFLTDKAGHSQNLERARRVLDSLDKLFARLAAAVDFARTTVVITSDHGNLEDLSTRSHTLNPVPLVVRGWASQYFVDSDDLTHVTPGIVQALSR